MASTLVEGVAGPARVDTASGATREAADERWARVLRLKGPAAITVCLPTRDNASTAPGIVADVARRLVRECRLVDEILVVDDGSTDDTRELCAQAGATVLCATESYPELGSAFGRGDLLWRAVGLASGDIVVWVDPARESFDADSIVALVEPLLLDDGVRLVRGVAPRRRRPGSDPERVRLPEVIDRPVLALLDPEVSSIREPLDGEYAARRDVLRGMTFEPDHGVEIGLLVDVVRAFGREALVEVDLAVLEPPYRSAVERARMTRQMLRAALMRSGRAALGAAVPQRPPHDSEPAAPTQAGR